MRALVCTSILLFALSGQLAAQEAELEGRWAAKLQVAQEFCEFWEFREFFKLAGAFAVASLERGLSGSAVG